jgi:hypothetical protein
MEEESEMSRERRESIRRCRQFMQSMPPGPWMAGALAVALLLLVPIAAAAGPPPPAPASGATPPTYTNYAAPSPLATGAGEPSLSFDAKTGNVMFQAGLQTLRVSFDDTVSPATASWRDVSFLPTSTLTLDPILFTDRTTGRTFVSQLSGAGSLMAYSDDDGASWTPSQGAGIPAGPDHQTVGVGPLPSGVLATLLYPSAVYYCSQAIALASCAVSLDGGLTFGPGVPMYNLTQCGGLHGHIKIAPDGTAYVPNANCGGQQGVAVSTNAGTTWSVQRVPGSMSPGASDPSVAVASDGTVYFGFADGSGHPAVAVSHDRGLTWTHVFDVGAALGIRNTAFPAMVAGDANRAALAFLGTPAGGNATGDDPNFPAVWHLYVAHTYDGGATWVTVDATPNDPVQRGTICTGGTACGSTRNLLDFMDARADARGRVLVGYADGCVGGCLGGPPNSGTAIGTISRQASGKGVYAAFD